MSASTVPLQCRWFLRTAGLHKGPLVASNHALLIISFLCCRIALFPYLFWAYSRSLGVPLLAVFSRVPWVCIWGSAGIMTLNAAWLTMLLRRPPRAGRSKGCAHSKAAGDSGELEEQLKEVEAKSDGVTAGGGSKDREDYTKAGEDSKKDS